MSLRAIEGIPVDRARLRLTTTYALTPRLSAGVELNPLDDDVGILANWRVLDETRQRPALVLGTSSDRIGSSSGRAGFATLSKDLEPLVDLPIAPYAGVTWGDFEDEWRAIGGVNVRWAERWSSTHLYDGVNLHHIIDHSFDAGPRLGLLVVEQDGKHYVGLRVTAPF